MPVEQDERDPVDVQSGVAPQPLLCTDGIRRNATPA
jgi:hypothetical protein